ncbi:MAG: phosphatidylglycerophosphatase A [Sedimentisphaerales bacterium]|nr:phosphatidylglycerophosphatase A [Sedimentisphaerales bacterium]
MYRLWLTVFGAGYSPFAPGTCGSAVVAVAFVLAALLSGNNSLVLALMGVLAIQGGVVTVLYSDRLIKELGPDPGMIVSDEQCGQAITYLWLWPLAQWQNTEIVILTVAGFLLFRVFDIFKPPPVRQFDKIQSSWGVLLDDVMAGIYANITLQIIYRLGWL